MAKSLDEIREECAIQARVMEGRLDEAIEDRQGRFNWHNSGSVVYMSVSTEWDEPVPQIILDEIASRYMAAGGWHQVDCFWTNGMLTLHMAPERETD